MSIAALTWALSQPIHDSTRKLTLVALADYAGADWTCYPGCDTLAGTVLRDERTVRRHVDALVDDGLVEKVRRRRRADGTLGTWLYLLNPTAGAGWKVPTPDPLDAEAQGLDPDLPAPPDTGDHRTPMSGSPPDTAVSALNRKNTFEPSGTTATPDDQLPALHQVMATTTVGKAVETWARSTDQWPEQHTTAVDAYRDLVRLVATRVDQPRHWQGQLLAEYLQMVTGDDAPLTPGERGHLNRLVASNGAEATLRYLAEAVEWGAGLPDDAADADPRRQGRRGMIRYAAAVGQRLNAEARKARR